MEFKIIDEKTAKHLGKNVGDVVDVPDSQKQKWIAYGLGEEIVKKESKAKKETKEFKVDKETKDATNKD